MKLLWIKLQKCVRFFHWYSGCNLCIDPWQHYDAGRGGGDDDDDDVADNDVGESDVVVIDAADGDDNAAEVVDD